MIGHAYGGGVGDDFLTWSPPPTARSPGGLHAESMAAEPLNMSYPC